MTPAGQAIKLYCQAANDHTEFIKALHIDAPNATAIFSREVYPTLLHGLWLLVHTVRLDMIPDDETTTQPTLSSHVEV